MRISDWSSDVCSSDLQINGQQSAQLQRAVRALERPILPPGHSPGQERLAELFIKNTPEKNHADPRLSPAQAIVDAAMKTAAERGESARMVATIRESTRPLVAARIQAGVSLAGANGHRAPVQEHARKEPCRSTPFARASDCRCRHEDGGRSG